MMGEKWAQKIQLGREATAGTAVAATTVWRGEGGTIKDDREHVTVPELIGVAIPSHRSYQPALMAALAMAVSDATYEQLPHILEAGIDGVTPVQDGTGTDYLYTYVAPLATMNTLKTYTLEGGDNQQAEEMEYSFVESFTISGAAKEALKMSANWLGRQVTKTTFTGGATVPDPVEDILGQLGALYIDPVGSIGTTQKSDTLLSFSLEVTTGWKAKFTMDSGQKYFSYVYFDKDSFQAQLTITYEHNGTAVSEKDAFQANTPRDIRLEFLGATLGTPGTKYSTKALQIDLTGKYTEWGELGDNEGNSIVEATFLVGYDPTQATGLTIEVANELTTLP